MKVLLNCSLDIFNIVRNGFNINVPTILNIRKQKKLPAELTGSFPETVIYSGVKEHFVGRRDLVAVQLTVCAGVGVAADRRV